MGEQPYQQSPAAAAQMNTLFSGIQAAKASMDSNYIRPGAYFLRIDRVRVDISRKQETFMAIEMKVLHVIDDDDGKGHKKDEDVTHMLMAKFDMFLPNVKAFIACALAMEAEQITEVEAMGVCGVDQPLTGSVVECRNKMIMTKDGNPFTRVGYQRAVPAKELMDILPPIDQEAFFPNQALQRIAALQAQQV